VIAESYHLAPVNIQKKKSRRENWISFREKDDKKKKNGRVPVPDSGCYGTQGSNMTVENGVLIAQVPIETIF
jgi:hypothetical protein